MSGDTLASLTQAFRADEEALARFRADPGRLAELEVFAHRALRALDPAVRAALPYLNTLLAAEAGPGFPAALAVLNAAEGPLLTILERYLADRAANAGAE